MLKAVLDMNLRLCAVKKKKTLFLGEKISGLNVRRFKEKLKYLNIKKNEKVEFPFVFSRANEKNKGMGAEKSGILLFRFLTSNEIKKYQ